MRHRGVAIAGLLGLVPIALGLVRQTMTISTAASRAVILLLALIVVETVVLPLLRPVLAPARPAAPATGPSAEDEG